MTELISSLTFKDLIHTTRFPVLIDVYGDCQPCQDTLSMVDVLAGELAGQVKVVKIRREEASTAGDENPLIKLVTETGCAPALMLFDNGKYIGMLMGEHSKEDVLKWMEDKLVQKLTGFIQQAA